MAKLDRYVDRFQKWGIFENIFYNEQFDILNLTMPSTTHQSTPDFFRIYSLNFASLFGENLINSFNNDNKVDVDVWIAFTGIPNWLRIKWTRTYGSNRLQDFMQSSSMPLMEYLNSIMDQSFNLKTYLKIKEIPHLCEFLPIPNYFSTPELVDDYKDLGFDEK